MFTKNTTRPTAESSQSPQSVQTKESKGLFAWYENKKLDWKVAELTERFPKDFFALLTQGEFRELCKNNTVDEAYAALQEVTQTTGIDNLRDVAVIAVSISQGKYSLQELHKTHSDLKSAMADAYPEEPGWANCVSMVEAAINSGGDAKGVVDLFKKMNDDCIRYIDYIGLDESPRTHDRWGDNLALIEMCIGPNGRLPTYEEIKSKREEVAKITRFPKSTQSTNHGTLYPRELGAEAWVDYIVGMHFRTGCPPKGCSEVLEAVVEHSTVTGLEPDKFLAGVREEMETNGNSGSRMVDELRALLAARQEQSKDRLACDKDRNEVMQDIIAGHASHEASGKTCKGNMPDWRVKLDDDEIDSLTRT